MKIIIKFLVIIIKKTIAYMYVNIRVIWKWHVKSTNMKISENLIIWNILYTLILIKSENGICYMVPWLCFSGRLFEWWTSLVSITRPRSDPGGGAAQTNRSPADGKNQWCAEELCSSKCIQDLTGFAKYATTKGHLRTSCILDRNYMS